MSMPWITSTPDHWQKLRAKNMFIKQNRAVREEDEVVTCFRDGTVTLRKNRRTTGFTESIQWSGYQGVRRGDLVIHVMDAFAGAIGVSDSDGKSTPVYNVCTAKIDINNNYYAYLLREMARTGFIQSLYRGIRERSSDFRFEVFAGLFLPLPPREEQDQIVRYLDWKVSQINKLINAKRRQIELLQEQIGVLTNQAITNTQSKMRLKHMVEVVRNWIVRDNESTYSPVGVLNRGRGIFHKDKLQGVDLGSSEFFEVESNTLMFSGQFAWEGAVALTTEREKICIASHRYYTVRGLDGICKNEYLWAFFRTKLGDLILNKCSHGAAGRNKPLNFNELLNEYILIPSVSIQEEIAHQVHMYMEYGALVKSFEILAIEYRTSLISDVVTGKLDVSSVVVPEYEAVEKKVTYIELPETLDETKTEKVGVEP